MQIEKLVSKIHRATVTQADLNYVGSITIDRDLLQAAGLAEYQRVFIADIDNGERFDTYTIEGEAGSGTVCLNGAAARKASLGDKVIIMAYGSMTPEEAGEVKPKVVFVDDQNAISKVSHYEKHGQLA